MKNVFSKYGKIIVAALAALVVVMAFLPAVSKTVEVFGEKSTTSYSLFDVAFGKTLAEGAVGGLVSGTSKIKFSILNVVVILLPVAAAVVSFVLKGKNSALIAAGCLLVAAILLFLVPSFSSIVTEVKSVLGNADPEVTKLSELEFGLGIGAILGAVFAILGAAASAVRFLNEK